MHLVVQRVEPKAGSDFAFACHAIDSFCTLPEVARFPNLYSFATWLAFGFN